MATVNPKTLRIVYMGTPDFAVAPLRTLVEAGYHVVAVVTMPDKPAGRGLKLQGSAVKQYAVSAGLPVLQPERLKSDEFVAQFQALQPDLGIVVAFRMLPEVIFASPKYGTFNLHASLLPQYRGAAPINWAIMNGETVTGVTTFLLNAGMDKGAVIDARQVVIGSEENAGTLHDKLMSVGASLVVDSVEKLVSEGFKAVPQPQIPEEELKAAPKIFKDTCHIDFGASGTDIINQIRGLSPYPGAWAHLTECSVTDGTVIRESTVKIYSARFEPIAEARAEEPLCSTVVIDGVLGIVCADGYIIPEQIQLAGKQRMNIREYLNGLKLKGELYFR